MATQRAGKDDKSQSVRGDLHALCRKGDVEGVKMLLSSGKAGHVDSRAGNLGLTPLHEACSNNNPDVCYWLLRYGVEVNRTTIEGKYTALHLAAFYRHHRCVETLLVEKGRLLNLTAVNADGKTALQLAQTKGYRDIVRLIRSGEVSQVVENEHAVDRIRYLLEKLQLQEMADASCAPNTEKVVTKLLETALRKAAQRSNIQAVGYLLQYGGCKANFIFDCFCDALRSNHPKVAIMLLLAHTALEGDTEQVRFLLAKDVDIGVGNVRYRELVQRYREVLELQLSIAVRVALQKEKIATAGELLFYMDCDTKTGKVGWFGLGLRCLPEQWFIRSSPTDSIHKAANCLWVTLLNISSNYLTSMPVAISCLQNLCVLDISRNNLGSPSEGNRLTVDVFALPHLKTINLSHAELRTFPEVPMWSPALTTLDLSGNFLRELPDSFGNAVTLDRLNLASNQLREVPNCIGRLIMLRALDLSENLAITRLPNIMGNLAHLIELKLHNLDISEPPDSMLGKPQMIVRYLRNRLRDLQQVRAAKIFVVGSSNQCRRQLVDALQQCRDCTAAVFDLGSLPLFSKFLEALDEVVHTHYLIVWDLKHRESIQEIMGYLDLIRRLLLDRASSKSRRQCLEVLIVPVFENEVSTDDQKLIADELENASELRSLLPVSAQVRAVAIEGSGFYSVGALVNKLETLRDDFLIMKDVPQTHRTIDKCFQRNKRQLSRSLDETAWVMKREDLWEQVDGLVGHDKNDIPRDNWQEMEKLLVFLQSTGQMMQLGDHNGPLDDIYFVTPQWVFLSLQRTFGPPSCAKIPRIAFRLPGLLLKDFLNDRSMFGSKPRSPLREYAIELAAHFSLAFPVTNELLYVPLQASPYFAWPHGEFSCIDLLLQSPTQSQHKDKVIELVKSGKLLHRFLVPASMRVKQDWWAYSFWDKLIAHILSSIPVLFTSVSGPEDYTSSVKKLQTSEGVPRFRSLAGLLACAQQNLSLWQHGMACWHGNTLDMAVFQLSTVPGCFDGFDKDPKETLCVVVPNDGRTGISRLAALLEMIFCLVEDVFNEDWQELEQLVPCPHCMFEEGRADSCFDVGKCLQLFTQGKVFKSMTCQRHANLVLLPEVLIPDVLLQDVDARFRFPHSELQYKTSDQIGAGGFGKVFLGFCEDQKAAFKESRMHQLEHVTQAMRTFREIRQECEVLKVFAMYHEPSEHRASPYFARCFGLCLRPLVLVSEYARFKSLDKILKESSTNLTHLFLVIVAMEIITSIKALHEMGIVYRDVKAGNVLVFAMDLQGDHPHVKLADFGTAVQLPPGQLFKVVGTPAYQAPEMLVKRSSYGFPVDVYAFGLLVYELISREQAFANINGPVGQAIRQGLRPHLNVLHFGCQLLQKVWYDCCRLKAGERPSACRVQQHLVRTEAHLLLQRTVFDEEMSVSFLESFVNKNGQQQLIVVSRGRESSYVRLTPVFQGNTDGESCLMHVVAEQPLAKNRVTCCCVVTAGQTLWLGTQHCRLVILSLVDLSLSESQILLPDVPTTIVANTYHVFIALANGEISTYPCRQPDSAMPGSRSRYCVQQTVFNNRSIAAMLLVNQHLWCMSSDQEVIVFVATSPPEPLRSYQGTVGISSMPAQALRFTYSPDTDQVWALFRQSSVLLAWDASQQNQPDEEDMIHDVLYDMRMDWVRAIDEARQHVHGVLLHPVLRPRYLTVCRDVLWVSTSCGLVLLYRVKQHTDLRFIGWIYPHTMPVGCLHTMVVQTTEGYSGPVVVTAGVGCPLYDKNGYFSLDQPDLLQKNNHGDLIDGAGNDLWEDDQAVVTGSPPPVIVQTPSQAGNVADVVARSRTTSQFSKRYSHNRLSSELEEEQTCHPSHFTLPGDKSIAALDLFPVEQSASPFFENFVPSDKNVLPLDDSTESDAEPPSKHVTNELPSLHDLLHGPNGHAGGLSRPQIPAGDQLSDDYEISRSWVSVGSISVNADNAGGTPATSFPPTTSLPPCEAPASASRLSKSSSPAASSHSSRSISPSSQPPVEIPKLLPKSESTMAMSVPKLNLPLSSPDQKATSGSHPTPSPQDATTPDIKDLDSCILFWQGCSAQEIEQLLATSQRSSAV